MPFYLFVSSMNVNVSVMNLSVSYTIGDSIPPCPAPSYTESRLNVDSGSAAKIFSDIHLGALSSSDPTTINIGFLNFGAM